MRISDGAIKKARREACVCSVIRPAVTVCLEAALERGSGTAARLPGLFSFSKRLTESPNAKRHPYTPRNPATHTEPHAPVRKHTHKHRCGPARGHVNTALRGTSPGNAGWDLSSPGFSQVVVWQDGAAAPGARSRLHPAPPIHEVQLVLPRLRHGRAGPSRCSAETFWGKSPVTVAVKRHSWGLFPPGLGCKASMRGCGCARGRGCGALPAGTGSRAGPFCPGVLEGAKEALILITEGLGKERAFHFVPRDW